MVVFEEVLYSTCVRLEKKTHSCSFSVPMDQPLAKRVLDPWEQEAKSRFRRSKKLPDSFFATHQSLDNARIQGQAYSRNHPRLDH